jgi:hypothetical protein
MVTMRGGRLALTLLAVAAVTGCANAGSGGSPSGPPSPGQSQTSSASGSDAAGGSTGPTVFRSTTMPYSLQLPPGWTAVPSSGDEDIYESPDLLLTLRVGTVRPEPGQTVEDRVRINRANQFAGCETDPGLDRGVTLGNERGILWAFTCDGKPGMVANTIRDGVGYRLTLRAYASDVEDIDALMTGIVESFAFLD